MPKKAKRVKRTLSDEDRRKYDDIRRRLDDERNEILDEARRRTRGPLRYVLEPVPGAAVDDLDRRRLINYFRDIRSQDTPGADDDEAWRALLNNTGLMVEDRGRAVPTVAALVLFGVRPHREVPQTGLTSVACESVEKNYDVKERNVIRGPAVALLAADGKIVEAGVIEQAIDFVRRNTTVRSFIDEGGRRQDRWDYPLEAVRETVVNAIAHRDYTITVTDIDLSIYCNRLEVISPGRLPNTVTVEKMRAGYRASRNELIKEVLRDYRYIEATGLGVPRKIIQGMRAHNGTDPDLLEEEDRFTVRLWKDRHPS